MPSFQMTASTASAIEGENVTITLVADSNFKDTVNLTASAALDSTFTLDPVSIYLCPNDVKTATLTITLANAEVDEITVEGFAATEQIVHSLSVGVIE